MPHLDEPRPNAPAPLEVELAEALPTPRRPLTRGVRLALRVTPLVLLAAAGWVLWREFHHLSFAAVAASMAVWGAGSIAAAVALSALSFLLMGAIEWVGLRWTGARPPLAATQMGSFLACPP